MALVTRTPACVWRFVLQTVPLVPITAVLAAASLAARAQTMIFQSSTQQTALLELYTSEGCSSCPPAEKWLSRLKTSPRLWKEFVPVAFHVDYWDYLGWRDPWSAKEFSDRQRAYAQHWRSESVYTPAVVLDGKEWRDWSAQADGPPLASRQSGILTVKSAGSNRWDVTFAPTKAGSENYQAHAALLASSLHSDVKAGENRGRRLDHDFIALSVVETPLGNTNGVSQGTLELPPVTQGKDSHLALAVWITKAGQLNVVQATGG
jgi:hypothetical protein